MSENELGQKDNKDTTESDICITNKKNSGKCTICYKGVFWQTSHLNGFSKVCSLSCAARLEALHNDFSQYPHLWRFLSLSLEWTCMCLFRELGNPYRLLHTLHTYFPSWLDLCFRKVYVCLNQSPHTSHWNCLLCFVFVVWLHWIPL
jgi:hypothetical protein